jgi:hypothetical protein
VQNALVDTAVHDTPGSSLVLKSSSHPKTEKDLEEVIPKISTALPAWVTEDPASAYAWNYIASTTVPASSQVKLNKKLAILAHARAALQKGVTTTLHWRK